MVFDRVVSGAFDVAARVRRGRVFHPVGMPLTGALHAVDADYGRLLGAAHRPVLARLSKGVGLPGALPDVLGLALRVLDHRERPWDLALATTGGGPLGRLLVVPARGWAHACYGSLMPYRFPGHEAEWILAQPLPTQPDTASVADLNTHLEHHRLDFVLRAVPWQGPARTLAEITLSKCEIGEHAGPGFYDPVTNRPAGVELLPRQVAEIRERAYAGSRHGRGEPDDIAAAGTPALQGTTTEP